jgi:hypothetical protein
MNAVIAENEFISAFQKRNGTLMAIGSGSGAKKNQQQNLRV